MKKLSRQREWQKIQKALGNCIICGKKRERLAMRCDGCQEQLLARLRERYKLKKDGVVRDYKKRDKQS